MACLGADVEGAGVEAAGVAAEEEGVVEEEKATAGVTTAMVGSEAGPGGKARAREAMAGEEATVETAKRR